MRCPNCGQRLADEAGRCPVCGTVIDEETRRQAMNEDDFASASFEGTRQSMGEQASAAQSGRTDQMAPDEKRYPARPMKWYKFLIYFSLVLTGFANIWTGVEAVLGMQYETKSQAAQVYAVYPGLHVLDIIYGGYALIVRQYLAGFKAKGPKMLLSMYIVSLVIEVAYIVASSLISGVNLLTASESGTMLISSMIVSLFMIGANKVYFDKRAHLFNK